MVLVQGKRSALGTVMPDDIDPDLMLMIERDLAGAPDVRENGPGVVNDQGIVSRAFLEEIDATRADPIVALQLHGHSQKSAEMYLYQTARDYSRKARLYFWWALIASGLLGAAGIALIRSRSKSK